jgi:hypothetical protein
MQKIKVIALLLSTLMISSVAFAQLPPSEPPIPSPVTSIPKLVGTWSGVLYDARESGYSNTLSEVMKITDQQGRLFRGYAQTSGNQPYFFAGTIEDDGMINVIQRDNSGFHSIWHGHLVWGASGGNPRQITFHVLNPIVPAAHIFTLTKTTP